MSEAPKSVPAGLDRSDQTVGLTGLVPFGILAPPPVELAPHTGVLRVWLDLPAGWRLDADEPLLLRVHGGEAGLHFERNGQIVRRRQVEMPIELPYVPRSYPEPPPAGQLVLDLSFHARTTGGTLFIQDVQWRQVVRWSAAGGRAIELRFGLAG